MARAEPAYCIYHRPCKEDNLHSNYKLLQKIVLTPIFLHTRPPVPTADNLVASIGGPSLNLSSAMSLQVRKCLWKSHGLELSIASRVKTHSFH